MLQVYNLPLEVTTNPLMLQVYNLPIDPLMLQVYNLPIDVTTNPLMLQPTVPTRWFYNLDVRCVSWFRFLCPT